MLGRDLYLLMDGRLVTVDTLGTWSLTQEELRTNATIVHAREVGLADAVRAFNFMLILVAMRRCLYQELPAQQAEAIPDLAGRRERFDALVADLTSAMSKHNLRLRRVGDSPA
jgi:hypothetical protein